MVFSLNHRCTLSLHLPPGVNTIVTAEVTSMPACKFQVQVQRS